MTAPSASAMTTLWASESSTRGGEFVSYNYKQLQNNCFIQTQRGGDSVLNTVLLSHQEIGCITYVYCDEDDAFDAVEFFLAEGENGNEDADG